MGLRVMLVLEMPSELDLILERSKKLDVKPMLGVRIRLSTGKRRALGRQWR